MGEIRSYRDLDVWQLGVELAVDCYALTSRFPADERFGLTGQARKAAVSIPSNVAEGQSPIATVQQCLPKSRQHSAGIQWRARHAVRDCPAIGLSEDRGSQSYERQARSCGSDVEATATEPRDTVPTEKMTAATWN